MVIMHSKEWLKSSNTGHLVRLAIKDAEVRIHGIGDQTVSCDGVDLASSSTLVLFPGRGAHPLTGRYVSTLGKPLTLLIPDGNWNQAKNMMRRVPMLRQARPVSLGGSRLNRNCLRRNARMDRMSTFEALAQALGILESNETETRLLGFFQKIMDGMMTTFPLP